MPQAHAQMLFSRDDERVFHAGLYAGVNLCQVDGDGFSGYRKPGFAGGAFVYARLSPLFQASLGIGYTQKGSREAQIRDYRLDLKYVELPALLHLFPGGRFHFSGGISYARLISVNESSDDVGANSFSEELFPFKKQDWSGIGGISFQLRNEWFLSGQYQYTLGGIRSAPDIPTGFGSGPERNNVLTLRLLYIIPSGEAR